jgi:hypothetical protein
LGNDLILVQECLDGFLVFRIANDDQSELVFIEGEAAAVFYITNSVPLPRVSRANFDVFRVFNSDSKGTTRLLHKVGACVRAVSVVLRVKKKPRFLLKISRL